MRLSLIGWILTAALLIAPSAAAQSATSPTITFPAANQVLQGQVAITGTTDIPNFSSAELDLGYTADGTNTRFLIQMMTEPIENNLLVTWDTTTISDGDYNLFLQVNLTDGTSQDITVPVKVRNYTALPAPTPTILPTVPALHVPTPIVLAPTMTPTLAPLPTPTMLPPNPLAMNKDEIYNEFWRGSLIVLFLFLAFGLIIRMRRS